MPILSLASSSRRRLGALSLVLLALFALRVSLWLMPFGPATSPDSLNYLAMAEGLAQGQGASIPSVGLEAAERTTVTLWAPLYPAWIALFLPVARTVVAATALANGVALMLLALLFQRVSRRWLDGLAASACAAVLLLMPSMHLVFSYAWSETVCLPLLMACYLALLNYASAAQPHVWRSGLTWLLCASVACALCIYTRYASVAFIPLLLGSVLWLRPQLSWRQRFGLATLAGAAIAIAIAPLLLRNLLVSGHLSGGDRTQTLIAPGSYAAGLIASLRFYLLGGSSWLLAACLLAVAAYAWHGRRRPAPPAEALQPAARQPTAAVRLSVTRDHSAALPLAWAAGYLIALLIMSRSQHIDNDARMSSLIVPFILLAGLGASAAAARRLGRLAWLPLLCLMVFWVARGAESLQRVRVAWTIHYSPEFVMIDEPMQIFNNFTTRPGDPRFDTLKQAVGALKQVGLGHVIVSDINPLVLNFVTGAPARWLPAVLDAKAIAGINALGRQGGALLITRQESLARLQTVYGAGLDGLHRVDPGAPLDAVLIALPLALPVERVKGIEPSS